MKNIDPQLAQAAIETLDGILTEESYTPYKLHVVINRILVANGEDKIRPQMMYNYARNGLIVKGQKLTGETLRPIEREEAVAFIARYILGKGLEVKFDAQKEEKKVTGVVVTETEPVEVALAMHEAILDEENEEPPAIEVEEFETVS